jgi:hypothetical protein
MRSHSMRDKVRGATRNKSSCSITFFIHSTSIDGFSCQLTVSINETNGDPGGTS